VTLFVGRGEEESRFRVVLSSLRDGGLPDEGHVVLVHGLGGIGKSMLLARYVQIAAGDDLPAAGVSVGGCWLRGLTGRLSSGSAPLISLLMAGRRSGWCWTGSIGRWAGQWLARSGILASRSGRSGPSGLRLRTCRSWLRMSGGRFPAVSRRRRPGCGCRGCGAGYRPRRGRSEWSGCCARGRTRPPGCGRRRRALIHDPAEARYW
jgi:hypothetical protein